MILWPPEAPQFELARILTHPSSHGGPGINIGFGWGTQVLDTDELKVVGRIVNKVAVGESDLSRQKDDFLSRKIDC